MVREYILSIEGESFIPFSTIQETFPKPGHFGFKHKFTTHHQTPFNILWPSTAWGRELLLLVRGDQHHVCDSCGAAVISTRVNCWPNSPKLATRGIYYCNKHALTEFPSLH